LSGPLEHSDEAPHRLLSSRELAREGPFALVRDEVEWPGGDRGIYRWFHATSAAFIVPVLEDGSTVLVRQWRYPWRETSWEVPAGTLEVAEEPLAGARRELAEETGLRAERWTPLGVVRPSALLDSRQFLFLAEGVSESERAPETYERDMITRRLPLADAVKEALAGGIVHATAVTALCRAAHELKVLRL
jgi:ADP-ribose pyrophosphatase